MCSAPVITPWRYEADITISRADQQDFRNDCQGRGGVVGDSNGDGVQDCTGAAPWTESNIAPMTKSIAGVWSSCLTGASSDTGWGYRDYYDICKDDYYKYSRAFNWLIIRECRKLTYQTRTCQYPDSAPGIMLSLRSSLEMPRAQMAIRWITESVFSRADGRM